MEISERPDNTEDVSIDDLVHRPKRQYIRKPKSELPQESIPELNQLEQNALLENLPNIEMMLQALMQACVLIRQKDQLERQVDILSRQAHDVRIALDREEHRLAEAKATRMEYARG